MSIPSGPQYTHVMAASSRIRFHVTKHKSNWLLEHLSESLGLNLIEHPLEYGGAGESDSRMCSKKVYVGLIKKKKSRERPVTKHIVKLKTKEKLLKETTGRFFFFFHVLWMFKPSSFPWQLTSRNLTFLVLLPSGFDT